MRACACVCIASLYPPSSNPNPRTQTPTPTNKALRDQDKNKELHSDISTLKKIRKQLLNEQVGFTRTAGYKVNNRPYVMEYTPNYLLIDDVPAR